MAALAAPIASLASSIFGGIYGGNRDRRVGEMIANTQEGTANDIINSTGAGQGMVANGGNMAIDAVNGAKDNANSILQGGMDAQTANLNPYLTAGQKGVNALADFATTAPSFTYSDYANDPAFKFEMDNGAAAINNQAAARGGAVGGNVLKDLTTYGQGLASTYYNDAFNRYMQERNSQLSGLTALTGVGQTATGQYDNAIQNGTNAQASNTYNAGVYQGNTNQNVAQFLANFGLQGTKLAGDYRIAGQQSRGAGLLGQVNALTGAVNGAAQSFSAIPWAGSSTSSPSPISSLPIYNPGLSTPRTF